jgi:hypothetical protein
MLLKNRQSSGTRDGYIRYVDSYFPLQFKLLIEFAVFENIFDPPANLAAFQLSLLDFSGLSHVAQNVAVIEAANPATKSFIKW